MLPELTWSAFLIPPVTQNARTFSIMLLTSNFPHTCLFEIKTRFNLCSLSAITLLAVTPLVRVRRFVAWYSVAHSCRQSESTPSYPCLFSA